MSVEYLHDPLGRRIAKKVNGVITDKYLWQGLTRLLAVYDGSDTLKMRFEYADGLHDRHTSLVRSITLIHLD